MISFHIGNIEPSEQNARSIVRLTSGDLLRAGLSEEETLLIADDTNEAHISRQTERLANYPNRYLGAIAAGELVGFVKLNEWNRADQLPFTSGVSRIGQKALLAGGNLQLEGRPQGIHGFVVADDDQFVGMFLLEKALALAEGRETRIAQYEGDPMNHVTQERGFVPTGRKGIVLGVQQELHVRPRTR